MEVDRVALKPSEPFRSVSHTDEEKDLYLRMQELEKEFDLLSMQEEYLREEMRHLKSEYVRAKEEVSCQKLG